MSGQIEYIASNLSKVAEIRDDQGTIAMVAFTFSHPRMHELAKAIQDAVQSLGDPDPYDGK